MQRERRGGEKQDLQLRVLSLRLLDLRRGYSPNQVNDCNKGSNRPAHARATFMARALRLESLVFGGCAFPPVSLGPAGDCPCRD